MKEEIKTGFKVMKISLPFKRELSSLYIRSTGRVVYKKEEWITPVEGQGPLTVFDSLNNLKSFIKTIMFPISIYKIKYIPSDEKVMYLVLDEMVSIVTGIERCPIGTVFAKKVYLLEEIEMRCCEDENVYLYRNEENF